MGIFKVSLDKFLQEFIFKINSSGILNTKISYTQISEWIDGVDGAENELRRRLLDPYEDLKIEENGDVPSFIKILEEMK